MATIKKKKKNDSGFDLDFIIKDKDGEIVNLTDSAVKFQLATMKYENKINKNCTITDAIAGECKYTFASGDLNQIPGQYRATLEITWGTKIVTTQQFVIQIINECG